MVVKSSKTQQEPETVRSVERAARIVTALAERPYSMTVRELAAHAGQSATSVHRMLTTLVAIGWAHQNANTGRYRLGTELLGVGSAGLITDPVVQNGRSFLQRFAESSGYTCFLSTLVGGRVVYLAQVEGRLSPPTPFEPGLSMPAHALADGKLLLAHLSPARRSYLFHVEEFRSYTAKTITDSKLLEDELASIRTRGYSVDRGERFDGMWGISIPVIRAQDRLLLAMLCIGKGKLSTESELELRDQMVVIVQGLNDHLSLVGDLPKPAVDVAKYNLE